MRRTIEARPQITQEIYLDSADISKITPAIIPEDLYGKGIGRLTTKLRSITSWSSDEVFDKYFNLLNIPQKNPYRKPLRTKLASDLHGNIKEKLMHVNEHTRAVSVFYTMDPKNEQFIMEWGKIDPDSKNCKTHDSIRLAVDYNERVKERMHVYSGHIAHIDKTSHYFSLIDSVSSLPTQNMSLMEKRLIDMLYNINFLPLSTDGKLLLPQFAQ